MKCPNCGLEIPEGHMYCDSCGTEINFVPDFDPEVENEINATLSGMADELNKEERERAAQDARRKALLRAILSRWKLICGVIAALFLSVILIVTFFVYHNKTSLYYLSLSEGARNSGDFNSAIECLKEGNRQHPDNPDIIFRMSDYYLEEGMDEEAINSLLLITDDKLFSEEKITSAYEGIISICRQNGDYERIAALLENSDDPIARSLRERYIPAMPVMTPASGSYDEVSIKLTLLDDSDNRIYYTVNGDDPNDGSILFENEIVLDSEGTYNVKAVAVNSFGIASAVAQSEYVIEKGAPSPPEIMEPSGEYNQNTMIVAVAQAGCSIFYTTDGSDPTMDSTQYISPITMPVGSSHFRFISFDNEGAASEIVDREYHLVYTRLVSTEQAVNLLVATLVRLDILLDNTGKVRGAEGHNEYIYNNVIDIQGAGEYYVVVENHVMNDGTSTPTGLIYAVNTHDGTVNRLGYDSSGKYTLITISNR